MPGYCIQGTASSILPESAVDKESMWQSILVWVIALSFLYCFDTCGLVTEGLQPMQRRVTYPKGVCVLMKYAGPSRGEGRGSFPGPRNIWEPCRCSKIKIFRIRFVYLTAKLIVQIVGLKWPWVPLWLLAGLEIWY